MLQFVMLLLSLQPALPPPPGLEVPHLPYLTAAGCEAAAARVALPPGLRLVCVPVEASTTQLAAMY
jgi:hypothetical protein